VGARIDRPASRPNRPNYRVSLPCRVDCTRGPNLERAAGRWACRTDNLKIVEQNKHRPRMRLISPAHYARDRHFQENRPSIATILAQAGARVAVSEANTVAKASICHPVMRFARARGNFAQMSKCTVAARHYCGVVGILPARTKTKRKPVIMKYALLVHGSQEYFDRGKDAAYIAAGMAYGEALRAAGVFVGGAGLRSPQTATTVSVRDGKRHVHDGPYAETKNFSAASPSLMCRIWMPHWNGPRAIPPLVSLRSRFVRWPGFDFSGGAKKPS